MYRIFAHKEYIYNHTTNILITNTRQVDELEHEASRLCGQLREVLTINKQLEHAHTTLERQLADATHTREQQQQQLAEADNAARAATGRCLELEVQLGNVEQEKAVGLVGWGGGCGGGGFLFL